MPRLLWMPPSRLLLVKPRHAALDGAAACSTCWQGGEGHFCMLLDLATAPVPSYMPLAAVLL